MENPERPERVNTLGKPRECDKIFFNLISSVSYHNEHKRMVIIYRGTLVKPCTICRDVHRELIEFTFYNQ